MRLMKGARAIPGVKKFYVRSGIRYDLAMESREYLRELCAHHISGLLKIAPEHVSPQVLRLMNKGRDRSGEFRRLFKELNRGRRQKLKDYDMVAHPGTSEKEACELARHLEKLEREGERLGEGG